MTVLVLLLLFILNVTYANALSLTFSGQPASVDAESPFTVDVQFSGSKSSCSGKNYYLRGAFYKPGTTNYFGLTENDQGEWVALPADKSEYYQFTTDEEGSWSGKLAVKAPVTDNGFVGAGEYAFKLGRYASATGSVDWSDTETLLTLNYSPPTPEPTPSPTPTVQPTSTPIPTASPTPKPSPSPTPRATPHPTVRPTPTPATSDRPSPSPSASLPLSGMTEVLSGDLSTVAGIIDSATASAQTISRRDSETKQTPNRYIPWIFVGGSVLILIGALPFGLRLLTDNRLE